MRRVVAGDRVRIVDPILDIPHGATAVVLRVTGDTMAVEWDKECVIPDMAFDSGVPWRSSGIYVRRFHIESPDPYVLEYYNAITE